MSDFEFSKAMIVIPHPDDGEFLAGGTMAKWSAEGKEIILVCATNGSAGSNDPDTDREWLIATREEEQRAAGAITGVKEVVFLGYEDGFLEDSHDLRRDIIREIRRHKPDVVVSMDPAMWYFPGRYINHPDHRAIAAATLAAVNPGATTVPLYRADLYDKGFGPHQITACLIGWTADPDYFVDITDVMETKIQAVLAHKSQMGDGEGVGDRIKMIGQMTAERAGTGAQYCEGFKSFVFQGNARDRSRSKESDS